MRLLNPVFSPSADKTNQIDAIANPKDSHFDFFSVSIFFFFNNKK